MDFIEFRRICSDNEIELNDLQILQLQSYQIELLNWNKRVNLISRKDEDNFLERHILHSVSALKYIKIPAKSYCIDIGTGGGLPGIPISIINPDCKILLVDSMQKKINTLKSIINSIGLKNVETRCSRVEILSEDKLFEKEFDFVFARAVSKTSEIISWITGIVKPSTKMIFFKGGNLSEEIGVAKKKFPKLNFKEIKIDLIGCDWFLREEKKLLVCEKLI